MWNTWLRRWLNRRPRPARSRSALPALEDLENRTLLSLYTASTYTTGRAPFAVTAADFFYTGALDLAVANADSNTVSVYLGNGDGTFQDPQTYAVGRDPESVSVGDFNFDGYPDLITANATGNNVSILYNNGDGTFAPAVTIPVTGNRAPEAVAAGDFRAYGGPFDFVTANNATNTVSVFLNNFDGTFTQYDYPLAAGARPVSVAVGDLNFDGYPDIVVADHGTNTVSVLYNNGDGTFQGPYDFGVGFSPVAVTLIDVRGWGVNDIATADYDGGDVSVLLNNFDGTFGPVQSFAAGQFPDSLAAADLNFDGYQDLITTNFLDNTVSVLLNNGDGTFGSPITFSVDRVPSALAVGDFNSDGLNDLAVANTNSNDLSVLLNDGNWSFGPGAAAGQSPGATADPFAGVGTALGHLLPADQVTPLAETVLAQSSPADTTRAVPPNAGAAPATAGETSASEATLRPALHPTAGSDDGLAGLDGGALLADPTGLAARP